VFVDEADFQKELDEAAKEDANAAAAAGAKA
jgi:hypothetical protein